MEYSRSSNKQRVGSLFAGVGGICQAFKEIGSRVVWANEFDRNACITYRLNHHDTNLIEDDIKNVCASDLQDIDILTAGFPCQPFSHAGLGKGFDDDRGQLFFQITRLLKELKPKAYLLENVKLLASHDSKKTFNTILSEIRKTGYSFIPFVLNAAEYTKIPQGRERIYIVGFKNEKDYYFKEPIKFNHGLFKPNYLSSRFKIPLKTNKSVNSIRSYLDRSTVLDNDIYNDKNNHIHRKVIENVVDYSKVYQFRRYYVRENKSNVCPTLTANMGSGGHNVPIILDENYPRRLTPKECFNLQGFPKEFNLPNSVPKGQLYKQAGNSVVVPMVKIIGSEIVRVLNEN